MPNRNFSDPHIVLDGFESLRRHHAAKVQIREAQLQEIPLPFEGTVLDVGVGPGLYLAAWLKQTESKKVTFDLLDTSSEALQLCTEEANRVGHGDRVHCIKGNLSSLPSIARKQYDAVFIGNTLEYVADPVGFLRQAIFPILRSGGILAVRELDCGIMNCSGVDAFLCSKIIQSRILGCKLISRVPENFHDPFMGRDLLRIGIAAGLAGLRLIPYYCEFRYPLKPVAKDYLSKLHMNWYIEDPACVLSGEDKQRWANSFDPKSKESVLNDPGFYYVESEILLVGKRS